MKLTFVIWDGEPKRSSIKHDGEPWSDLGW